MFFKHIRVLILSYLWTKYRTKVIVLHFVASWYACGLRPVFRAYSTKMLAKRLVFTGNSDNFARGWAKARLWRLPQWWNW